VCVCVCVRSISAGSLATNRQIRRALVCICIVLTACCLVYFFVYGHSCFYGRLPPPSHPHFWLSLLYLCGLYARAPHMLTLYLYISMASMSLNFPGIRLALLLYGLLMSLPYPCEFVSVCLYCFFFATPFCHSFVVVIKLWLLSNCFYWLADFTSVLTGPCLVSFSFANEFHIIELSWHFQIESL